MILTMKAISLGFDMDRAHEKKASEALPPKDEDAAEESGPSKTRRPNRKSSRNRGRSASSSGPETPTDAVDLTVLPNVLEYLGYTLCPGTSVFGPWVTYEEYQRIFSDPVWVSVDITSVDCRNEWAS